MLYKWRDAERPLGSSAFTARELIIETFREDGGSCKATGTLDTMDYIENCGGPQRWEAQGTKQSAEAAEWQVEPPAGDAFFRNRKTGRLMFTCSMTFDRPLTAFVAECLNDFLARRDGTEIPIINTMPTYDGPKIDYNGPCVCDQIAKSTEENPFPWEELTQGGQFPQHCFKCSCGSKWWETDTGVGKRWLPVVDEKAWEMLLVGNGELAAPFSFMEGGIQLVSTLRRRGMILLP